MDDSELTQLRRRIETLEAAIERVKPSSIDNGAACRLVETTTKAAYPTAAAAWYYCKVLRPGGTPVEGGAGTVTDTGKRLYALNVGAKIPPSGTKLLAHYDGTAWLIAYA